MLIYAGISLFLYRFKINLYAYIYIIKISLIKEVVLVVDIPLM